MPANDRGQLRAGASASPPEEDDKPRVIYYYFLHQLQKCGSVGCGPAPS